MNYQQAKHEFRLSNDGDTWGHVMGWLFAIGDHLTFDRTDVQVPDEWQFSPSTFGADDDSYALEILRECWMSSKDLERFMGLLWRLKAKAKAADLDY